MPNKRRVVVAEDHPAVMAAPRRILEPYCDVVSTAIDGEDLLREVDSALPDVVVTDDFMPKMNGLDACRAIRQTYPSVRIAFVSEFLDDDVMASAFELGATAV